MAAIYSNGGNRWNILGFNFTKRDALSSVYKISMLRGSALTNCGTEVLLSSSNHKFIFTILSISFDRIKSLQ